ncbi:hypothetical protein R3P38DRAFT_3199457 [Favolaschia claudopus]|uniref:Uncharacterized protein n=1 Tax=Favolaschia claudopus TaxID=2862362 RepID=A0AAW0B016_9AGAR
MPFVPRIAAVVRRSDQDFLDILGESPSHLVYYPFGLKSIALVVAWPMRNGARLTPPEVMDTLRVEEIYIPCLCAQLEDRPLGAEFITFLDAGDHRCYLYCHYDPPRCGFFLDLHKIYRETTYEYEYPSPLLSSIPYQKSLGNYFWSPAVPDRGEMFKPVLVPGFLGEIWEAGFDRDQRMRRRLCYDFSLAFGQLGPKHIAPVAALPPPLTRNRATQTYDNFLFEDPSLLVTDREKAAFTCLSKEEGLTTKELNALLKRCNVCECWFLARVLRTHTTQCGRMDSDSDSDPPRLRDVGTSM